MKKLAASLLALILISGCASQGGSGKEDKTITIGASPTPHAEILKQVQPVLEEQGYELKIKEFTDYNTPNTALADGSLDANYFQHEPYLEEWMKEAGKEGELKSVFAVHFEPLGIYSVNHADLKIQKGAKIAIPNDATNGGRALKLLEGNGIIKLKDGIGIEATKSDITENKQDVEIIEMQAESCGLQIQDVDYAVVNGNNALNAKISDKVLATEDSGSEGAQKYKNIIAVRSGDENAKKIQALVDALNSEKVKTYIEDTYEGIVVPLVPSEKN